MGMRIRPANPADAGPMSKVHVDTWRTAYAGIVPAGHLAGLSYRNRGARWEQILTADRPAESNFVAETGDGDIVGLAGGGPEREGNPTHRGELYGIYLLEAYQRKGLGRRLVSAMAQWLLSDGFSSMLVWVLADNHPACRFYESLGGELIGWKTIAIGGTDLADVSYGWRDIANLAVEPAA